jgi:hypothetical protein
VDYDKEQISAVPGQGLNALVTEVESWNLNEENSFRHKDRTRQNDIWSVLRIIFGIFAIVLAVLYYTAVFFTLFDSETKKTIFNANGGRKTFPSSSSSTGGGQTTTYQKVV